MASDYSVPRDLLDRYNQAGPRYTSYPTVPEWQAFEQADISKAFADNAKSRALVPLSLYVHIPFCTKLCYYCGCNIHLNRSTELVERYLAAVAQELAWVAARVDCRERPVVQIHWGGGTPTHLTPDQIARLFALLTDHFSIQPGAEISLEVHPAVTTAAQMETLAQLGFNRVSMGVQDFDPVVQKAVHRLQSYELTRDLVELARRLRFLSVNLDLMYGLPHQSLSGFAETLAKVMEIRPDRVALFSYAHLPRIYPHQRAFQELPDADLKLGLLELAVSTFQSHGYAYIGLDHFALPDNELVVAQKDRSLRRNFMGYTTCADSDLLAFGMSAISDLDGAYVQNRRTVSDYLDAAGRGDHPGIRGLHLSQDDRLRRDIINTIICHGYLDKADISTRHHFDFDLTFGRELAELSGMVADGLLELGTDHLQVLPRGQMLVRNICMVFDAYLRERPVASRTFSRTI